MITNADSGPAETKLTCGHTVPAHTHCHFVRRDGWRGFVCVNCMRPFKSFKAFVANEMALNAAPLGPR